MIKKDLNFPESKMVGGGRKPPPTMPRPEIDPSRYRAPRAARADAAPRFCSHCGHPIYPPCA